MQKTYPFDPYDWTTITPLLQALIDAPVASDGFMAWLAQWNQLDIAIWDAYTTWLATLELESIPHAAVHDRVPNGDCGGLSIWAVGGNRSSARH